MKNLNKILKSKFRLCFGYKYDTTEIPYGNNCYCIDDDKTSKLVDEWESGVYIKPCKYYINMGNLYSSCEFTGKISKDLKFKNKCKICNINKNESDCN